MKTAVATALTPVVLLLSGCSPSEVINTRGDTKCKEFVTQNEKKQTDEVAAMITDKQLQDRNGADPTPAEISSTRSLVVTYCHTTGNADPDSKINEAPHA
jgi:acid stress chaperone HdeA